jgi:conjugative transfer signal peptidase TraF
VISHVLSAMGAGAARRMSGGRQGGSVVAGAHVIEMQPTFGERRTRRRVRALARLGVVLAAGLPLLWLAHAHRDVLLVNRTPSEPIGLYVRAARDPVQAGALIAFRAPRGAFPYADRREGFLHEMPILKAVAAVAGDRVCTFGGVLTINGVRRAPVEQRDGQGVVLPHWIGCRRLAQGEAFAFSDRVPNSFDSRYFGPVKAARAQVYRPLLTIPDLHHEEAGR